jgi:hypothetical protein
MSVWEQQLFLSTFVSPTMQCILLVCITATTNSTTQLSPLHSCRQNLNLDLDIRAFVDLDVLLRIQASEADYYAQISERAF